jgi:hypothetical protein
VQSLALCAATVSLPLETDSVARDGCRVAGFDCSFLWCRDDSSQHQHQGAAVHHLGERNPLSGTRTLKMVDFSLTL